MKVYLLFLEKKKHKLQVFDKNYISMMVILSMCLEHV